MSVQGEFQRILGELQGFLRRTAAPGSERWTEALERAAEQGREDVSAGAEHALHLLQGEGPAPSFASDLEIEEFARLQEHLTTLCRAVLGR